MNNTKALIISLTLCFLVVLGTYSCSPQQTKMDKPFDRSGEVLQVKVMTFTTYRAMYKAIEASHPWFEIPDGLQGLALWEEDEYGNPASDECLIYVLVPTHIDDERTTILGHEMNHCLYGSFHEE